MLVAEYGIDMAAELDRPSLSPSMLRSYAYWTPVVAPVGA